MLVIRQIRNINRNLNRSICSKVAGNDTIKQLPAKIVGKKGIWEMWEMWIMWIMWELRFFYRILAQAPFPPPHREAMPPEPRSGDIIVKKNPTARRGAVGKSKHTMRKLGRR
jgi:hypothetical protein